MLEWWLQLDSALRMFTCGFMGSIAVELSYVVDRFKRGQKFPQCYSNWPYYVARTTLAVFAGWLAAIVYQSHNEMLAFHVGVSAPLIVNHFSEKPPS